MPFDAALLMLVESGLAEGFGYHSELDAFLIRSNVPHDLLAAARAQAENRNGLTGKFSRAPKRYVAHEVVNGIHARRAEADIIFAAICTSFVKGTFPNASPDGLNAIEAIKARYVIDRQERISNLEIKERERRAQEEIIKERLQEAQRLQAQEQEDRDRKRRSFEKQLHDLTAQNDAQARGYAFEEFLTELFDFEGLAPRGSFKNKGEQIDGSFEFRSRVNLLEAKWTTDRCAGAEFGAFIYKIQGKTLDTRGLFVAINGYSREALEGLSKKGPLSFVCIDGSHLYRAVQQGFSMTKVLQIVWRTADEHGVAYTAPDKIV